MKIFTAILTLLISLQSFSQQTEIKDTSTFRLKVKLIKADPLPAGCGVFAFALAQKFQVIEGSFGPIKPKMVILLIEPCPEFLGEGFFVKDRIYNVKVSSNSGAPFQYLVRNAYDKENFLCFWVRDIKLQAQ